ncbi:methionyl-tRNA formyltransferase [Microbacterium sp. P03]|uniref:methionyl-tRNA formyltransferase n=1 Tax=Microbacterium sp. P03 TaxID=3366946 RepID=UPI003746CC31
MRLVFAGTPDAAVPSLRTLAASAHDLVAVVTRRDAPIGRKRVLTPSAVARDAADLSLPVVKTDRLDAAATASLAELTPDLGVIVAYGGLVREPLLSAPTHGWINLHFSLLPRWRGAAPVQRALLAGDRRTGASVFQLVAELDAGDVFAEEVYDIPPDSTSGDVLEALSAQGAKLLLSVVDGIAAGTATAVPQTGEPTYAPKLSAEDGLVAWDDPSERVLARIHGATPEPGAHTTVDGARVKILAARAAATDAAPEDGAEDEPLTPGEVRVRGASVLIGTGTRPVVVDVVQPAGKGAMGAADWRRGLRGAAVVGS